MSVAPDDTARRTPLIQIVQKRWESDHQTQVGALVSVRLQMYKRIVLRILPEQEIAWGVERIRAPLAWPHSTGEHIRVAVLDTWVDVDHPILTGQIERQESFISSGVSTSGMVWHGTHVAGTIAARNTHYGSVGVAPSVSLCCLNVLGSSGGKFEGRIRDIIDALNWCVINGIRLVNLSLGAPISTPSLKIAIENATRRGVIIVAAAGNNGDGFGTQDGRVEYPAAYEEVIAVSGITQQDTLMRDSSCGSAVDLAAPGEEITSAVPREAARGAKVDTFYLEAADKFGVYSELSGTSMACPHVTGVVALVLSKYEGLSPEAMKAHLTGTARRLAIPDEHQGAGLVDAYQAVTTRCAGVTA